MYTPWSLTYFNVWPNIYFCNHELTTTSRGHYFVCMHHPQFRNSSLDNTTSNKLLKLKSHKSTRLENPHNLRIFFHIQMLNKFYREIWVNWRRQQHTIATHFLYLTRYFFFSKVKLTPIPESNKTNIKHKTKITQYICEMWRSINVYVACMCRVY